MSAYQKEFMDAISRTERFGLEVPPHELNLSSRWLDARAIGEFPKVVLKAIGPLDLDDVVAQCLSIHYRLREPLSDWLGCEPIYTIGWVEVEDNHLFRFDDHFIEDALKSGHPKWSMNIHTWLTLPSMEIIDMSLPTSIGHFQNIKELLGGVITMHHDDLRGMAYKPMLVGDGFLRKTGKLIEF